MSHLTLVNSLEKRQYYYDRQQCEGLFLLSRYYVKRGTGSHICTRDLALGVVSASLKDAHRVVSTHKPKKFFFSQLLQLQERVNDSLSVGVMLLLEHCCHDDVEPRSDLRLGELPSNRDWIDSATSVIVEALKEPGTLLCVPGKWWKGFEDNLDRIMLNAKNVTGENYG